MYFSLCGISLCRLQLSIVCELDEDDNILWLIYAEIQVIQVVHIIFLLAVSMLYTKKKYNISSLLFVSAQWRKYTTKLYRNVIYLDFVIYFEK